LSDADVIAACTEAAQGDVVEAVNFNAPSQVVIAGSKAAVERACDIAKAKGAKRALILAVSAPFHSSLLQPASDRLREYLADVSFAAGTIPLINNVDVAIVNDPASFRDALVRQAARPVRWVETVQQIAAAGIMQIVECGPGKVLAGLTKRIDPQLTAEAITDDASMQRVIAQLNESNS
jgi:[acyl-carrier-protein] S-malonyltransferase